MLVADSLYVGPEDGEEAGGLVATFPVRSRSACGRAVVLGARAAGTERAAFRRVYGRRHISGEDHALVFALLLRIGDGDGGEERGGVGMARLAVESVSVGDLYDLAEVHHGDPVRDVFDHGEVVGYEDVGEVELLLQVLEQVDDLRLDRDVKAETGSSQMIRRGLRAMALATPILLPLASGELVRVTVVVLGFQADTSRSSCTRRLRSPELPPTSWVLSGSETMLPTVMRGFRLA